MVQQVKPCVCHLLLVTNALCHGVSVQTDTEGSCPPLSAYFTPPASYLVPPPSAFCAGQRPGSKRLAEARSRPSPNLRGEGAELQRSSSRCLERRPHLGRDSSPLVHCWVPLLKTQRILISAALCLGLGVQRFASPGNLQPGEKWGDGRMWGAWMWATGKAYSKDSPCPPIHSAVPLGRPSPGARTFFCGSSSVFQRASQLSTRIVLT